MTPPDQAPKSPEISRDRPGCLVFLLDESASMADPFLGSQRSKADALAFAVNATIYRLVLRSMPYGEVRDYFHVGAIGYGGAGVRLAWGGELEGYDLVKLSVLARSEVGTQTRGDGEPEPYWIVPKTSGMTPMCAAIDQATDIISRFADDYPDSLPPIVLNVTDGQASDGHPRSAAARLMATGTRQGPSMLFNLQLSNGGLAVSYPANEKTLTDAYARVLFAASSPLPEYMVGMGRALGLPIADGARGFVHNADMTTLVRFLTIGTQPGNLV